VLLMTSFLPFGFLDVVPLFLLVNYDFCDASLSILLDALIRTVP